MKILVTGNMGYVGPSVVQQLRKVFPSAEIIGADSAFFAHCLTNTTVFPERYLDKQIFIDVREIPSSLLQGCDAVVSLAAISNDIMGKIDEQITMAINAEASIRLAEMARAAGVSSFVFASSCSVYGAGGDGAKTESATVNPLTAYARSKIETEVRLERLAASDFRVTCLRFATACGMSDRLRLDLVLNDFVACALAAGKITVLSDGSPWRPLIHVKDMARAIEWAVTRETEAGGSFLSVNTGSDHWNYQVKDLAAAVASEIADTEVSIDAAAPPDKRSYRVDFGYFRRLAPNHQPQVDLLMAVRELRAGLEGMRFQNSNFRESEFMRIKVLTGHLQAERLNRDLHWVNP